MATITTINGSDEVSASRSVINTNFSNLNSSKIETLSDLGITASAAEINYTDGVTANIQTQLGYTKRIYKSADETVNNSSVMQNDDELFFSIGANEAWSFTFHAMFQSNSTADIKFVWSIPAGASGYYQQDDYLGNSFALTDSYTFALGNTSVYIAGFYGVVINSSTAGTFQLQWAQGTQTVVDTKLLKGSNIIAQRLV